jgi:hypothetical protein
MERPPSGLKVMKHLSQTFPTEYTENHLDADIGLFAGDTL